MSITDKNGQYLDKLSTKLAGSRHYNFGEIWNPDGIVFEKGSGARLRDVNGKEYLDFYSNFGSNILGHAHQEYMSGVFQAVAKASSNSLSELSLGVSEQICSLVPSADMVRFPVTGTEAVQSAIRLARAHTGKQKFLRFTGNYHGHADNTLGGKPADGDTPYPVDFSGDARASKGVANGVREKQSLLIPWNDLDKLTEVLENHGQDIACVITEPLAVNAGGIEPVKGYLQGMRDLCDKHNVVLVFDEIITGFRVGLGGAQELYGVTPDLTTMGKALGGGMMPIAAIAGKRDIMSLIERNEVVQAGTFNGYHAGLSAVQSTLNILQGDNDNISNVAENGQRLMAVFSEKADKYGIPLTIQSHPSCFVMHVTENELTATEQWTADIKKDDVGLQNTLLENGVILAPMARCYPSVTLTDDDVSLLETRVDSAFKQFEQRSHLTNG